MFAPLSPLLCALIVPPSKLPGDVRFDPLNLKSITPPLLTTRRTDSLTQYREAELKHGRIAMLASVAYPMQERFHPEIAKNWNMPNLLEATGGLSPSLVNGGLAQEPLPMFLALMAVLVGVIELRTLHLPYGPLPGDLGVKRRINSNTMYLMQSGEIWNARFAMLGVIASVMWEGFDKTPIIDVIRP